MPSLSRALSFSLLLAAAFLTPAAAATEPADKRHVTPSLIAETAAIAPSDTLWVAVRLVMEDSWHVYWKNPGDSGTPVRIDWTLPPGFEAGDIRWPYPKLIVVPPVHTYGYEEEAILLVPIRTPAGLRPGQRVTLSARLRWLECRIECIPGEARLELTLPVASGPVSPDPAASALFTAARERLPIDGSGWALSASQTPRFVRLSATPPDWIDQPVPSARFFPEDRNFFRYDAPQSWKKSKGGYHIDIARSDVSTGPVSVLRGVLVSESGWRGAGSERALDVDVPVEGTPSEGAGGLAAALALAFLGGIILNLMPCVLPVLSIKVLGLVHQAGMTSAARIRHGLAYTAGVVATFLALASLLLVLRAGGAHLGWGFQLQSPAIVAALAGLLFLLSLNLFGVFEIGATMTRLGGARAGSGYGGSFASGLLATLVATPCTAPFMGSALGFALTQPATASLAVFAALALGMASPYVLLTASPRLLKWVPRPGAWMESVKQGLGFLLAASVVWLLWVLGRQAGVEAMAAVCAGFVLQGAGAWIYGRWSAPTRSGAVRAVAIVAALALVSAGTAIAVTAPRAGAPVASGSSVLPMEPYSEEKVAALRAAGRPVFIDFTAAWCLTCLVNERVALNTEEVVDKARERNIAVLKADWTLRDPAITRALAALGRSGVPAYVLYPSDPSEPGRVLPEVLTPAILVAAFDAVQ